MISDATLRILLPDAVVRLLGDLIRTVGYILVALLVAALGAIDWALSSISLHYLHYNDFGKFYYSTVLFNQGQNMYGPTPATSIPILQQGPLQFLDMNPPHFHWLLMPLVAMPIEQAFTWWSIASAVFAVLSVVVVARELNLKWTLKGFLLTLLFAVGCTPTFATTVTGQLTFLLLLPLTLAWRDARRQRWTRAGAWLGLLISVKAFLAVFGLYFLIKKRWSALASSGCALVAVFGVGFLTFGFGPYRDWGAALNAVSWTWAPMNASLVGLASRVFDGGPEFVPLLRSPVGARIVGALLAVFAGAITFYRIWKDRTAGSVDRDFAALLLLSIVASPLGWVYYLWWLAGPTAALWLGETRRPKARDVVALCALPGLFFPLSASLRLRRFALAGATIGSVFAWTALLLWLAVMLDYNLPAAPSGEVIGNG